MAKDASQYPVTFGYLETSGSYIHRGEDRAMPSGTPIIVNGTTIGLSGNTGLSTGPHLHLQCGRDEWAQNTIKPTAYWFKGTIVHRTGTASEWGNYVIVKSGSVYCVYAHLSKISVKQGDKLMGNLTTSSDADVYARFYTGKPATKTTKASFVGKKSTAELQKYLEASTTYKSNISKAKSGKLSLATVIQHLNKGLRSVYKPPKEVDVTSNDPEVRASLKEKITNFIKGA